MKNKIYKIISGYAFESMTIQEINKTVDQIMKVFDERKDEIYWKGYDACNKYHLKQQLEEET